MAWLIRGANRDEPTGWVSDTGNRPYSFWVWLMQRGGRVNRTIVLPSSVLYCRFCQVSVKCKASQEDVQRTAETMRPEPSCAVTSGSLAGGDAGCATFGDRIRTSVVVVDVEKAAFVTSAGVAVGLGLLS